MAAPNGGVFDQREELQERLRQGPGEAARQELGLAEEAGPPPRWSLRTIRASIPRLRHYSLSGLWRLLRACKLRWRAAKEHYYSPDPDYVAKVAHLLACLRAAAARPGRVEVVFLHEMGYYRWPAPAREWAPSAPAEAPTTQRGGTGNQQWRIIGALNALTGRTTYRDGYIIGRAQVIAFYKQLVQAYPEAERIYVVQDNWPVHRHAEVLAALEEWPQIEPVWLPTYAPWLNPIEKLWRWLREDVLKMHRLAAAWPELRERVRGFLEQFRAGSEQLRGYVGLRGPGKLARALGAR